MRENQKESGKSEEMDCLKSLRTTAYEYTMEKNPERVPGTCEWFLHHPKYCEWLDEPASNLLWVTADPGCGKSVLSRFLIQDYRSWMWKDTSICYFFFKDDSVENKSAMHALCAILHQLFRQNNALLKHAADEYKSNGNKLPQLFGSLWSILMKAAADSNSGHIVCVIDALDECDESSCEQLIKHLADFQSNTSLTTRIKFLITSRPNDFIRRVFFRHFSKHQDPASLKLMGENEREMEEISFEINLVIDAKVKDFMELRLLEYGIDDDAHVTVQEQLKKIENRTYLWMALIFPELEKMVGYAEDELLETIKRIPPTIDKAYEKILANSRDVAKARRLLHIVCAASRPLTLIEMNRALSIDGNGSHRRLVPSESFPNTVRGLCGLFVRIQHERIYLIHQTAKEFLIPPNLAGESAGPVLSGKGSWKHSLEPTESNLILAKICISYLLSPVFESDPLAIDIRTYRNFRDKADQYANKYDFFDYSAHHWASHFRVAEVKEKAILKSALEVCDTRSKRFQTWFGVYWNTTYYSSNAPGFTDLMVASFFGHAAAVELLLQKGAELESQDKNGRTPLSWAAEKGHTEVVELLLQKGAELESEGDDGGTPLSWAAVNGHTEVVELLLQKGAEVESKDKDGWTPLSWAAEDGHTEVVELLLQKGAEVESKDKDGRTPLSWAAKEGHTEVVELLLQKGAELESKDDTYGWTPLSWAAESGHTEVVELLLQKGAKQVPQDD
jgi:ankyrin repeat domain-containing protein 50